MEKNVVDQFLGNVFSRSNFFYSPKPVFPKKKKKKKKKKKIEQFKQNLTYKESVRENFEANNMHTVIDDAVRY